jgi:hypothetical protein
VNRDELTAALDPWTAQRDAGRELLTALAEYLCATALPTSGTPEGVLVAKVQSVAARLEKPPQPIADNVPRW